MLERDGASVSGVALSGAGVVVKGNHFRAVGMGADYQGVFSIDDRKRPRTLDLDVHSDPSSPLVRNKGIFDVDGDRWTLCLSIEGTRRPRSFAAPAGSGIVLEVLERVARLRPGSKATRAASVAPPSPAASPATAAASSAATALDGEWLMESAVLNGAPLPADMVRWCRRLTGGGLTTITAGPQVMLKARFSVDDPRRPSAIDYVNLEGNARGKSQAGIVSLDGDLLRICMGAPGGPRPADFASASGDGRSLTTWRRA